jgi:uncharacterized protein (DUF1697 family)
MTDSRSPAADGMEPNVALLRAVNVGRTGALAMRDLIAICADLW